ncbi:MAG: DUF1573 domain-containing protein [Bacteroidales bacterium]
MKRLITFLFLFSICLGSVNAQNSKKSTKAESLKATSVKIQGPEISFENTVYDYGEIKRGDNGDCVFTFTNIGNEPLILSNVQSSCGCTTPSWPREPIMPGKKASIKVHYDTNRVGSISKSITVTTNGKTDRIVLRITGNILTA